MMICWPRDASSSSSDEDERVTHDYHDHANDNDFMNSSMMPGGLSYEHVFPHLASGRGNEQPFPVKLHCMLETVEKDNMTSVISWQPHGRCFLVHSQDEFVDKYLKSWFRQTKFPSFQRQLNLYGFKRITAGPDKGGYYHEMFLRSRRFLSYRIHRLKIKGTGVRKPAAPEAEPNFYKIPYLPPTSFKHENSGVRSSVFSNEEMKSDSTSMALMDPAVLFSAAVAKAPEDCNSSPDSDSGRQTCVLPVPMPPPASWFSAPPSTSSPRTHSVIRQTNPQSNLMNHTLTEAPQKFSIKCEVTEPLLPNISSVGQNPGSLLGWCWPPTARNSPEDLRQQFVRFCGQQLESTGGSSYPGTATGVDTRRDAQEECTQHVGTAANQLSSPQQGATGGQQTVVRPSSPDFFDDQQDDDALPCDTEFEEMVHSLMRMPPSNSIKK